MYKLHTQGLNPTYNALALEIDERVLKQKNKYLV